MKKFRSVIVVGSSGTGKTTLVNGLRTTKYSDSLVIPHRYITRPKRLGDDLVENSHIDHKTFESRVESGLINPAWQRTLDKGRIEKYGFDTVDETDTRIRIYSANNAFLRDKNKSVAKILEDALVVVLMADGDARKARLGERSPDMSDSERAVRLHDSGADMLDASVPIHTIITSGLTPVEGQKTLQKIVDKLLAN